MENFELINVFLEYFSIRFDFLKNIFPENFGIYIDFLPVFLISLIFSFLLTPIIGYIAKKFNILDQPSEFRKEKLNIHDDPKRHIHKTPTPLLGGLAFIIPVIIVLILLFNISPEIQAILIGVLILVVIGILDDVFNLPATYQLIGQVVAASIICLSPIGLASLNIPFIGEVNLEWYMASLGIIGELIFPGDLIMLLWILVCMNAIKFIAGSDGLMEGNAIIICLLFFVLGMRTEAEIIIILSLVLAGGLGGFLFYNFPPAKIFSGSSGKTTLGFLIAVIAILNYTKFAASIMILTLPMIDFFFVVIKRYITYKPKNLLDLIRINDTNHLHHQLINLGLTPKKVLLVETSITLAVGLIAVLTVEAMNLFFFFLIILVTLMIIFVIHMIVNSQKTPPEQPPKEKSAESPESKYSY